MMMRWFPTLKISSTARSCVFIFTQIEIKEIHKPIPLIQTVFDIVQYAHINCTAYVEIGEIVV